MHEAMCQLIYPVEKQVKLACMQLCATMARLLLEPEQSSWSWLTQGMIP